MTSFRSINSVKSSHSFLSISEYYLNFDKIPHFPDIFKMKSIVLTCVLEWNSLREGL